MDWDNLLHPDFPDIETMLRQWYSSEKLLIAAVAGRIGINSMPLRKKLIACGIPLKPKGKPGPHNVRTEIKQAPNKVSEYDYKLMQEGYRLKMRPDNYNGETRLSENRGCKSYRDCSTYTAILHGLVIPCSICNGTPQFQDAMDKTLPAFREMLNASPDRQSNIRYYENSKPRQKAEWRIMREWIVGEKIDTSRLFMNKYFQIYYVP